MATLPDNPCRERHPEFRLWIEATAFGNLSPKYACPRCWIVLDIEDAVRLDERAKVAEEITPLLDATRVALSSGCMCDYYYGTDGCTGRGNCWTPTAWTLNPDDVRAAISRQHAAAPAVVAAAGRTPAPESPRKHDAPQRATGGVYTGPPIPLGTYGCVLNPFETPDTRDDRQEQ